MINKLFNDAIKNTVTLYVTPITISELIYAASRIYEIAAVEKPNEDAQNYVEWLNARIKTVELTSNIPVMHNKMAW